MKRFLILWMLFVSMEAGVMAQEADLMRDMETIADRLRAEWVERTISQEQVQEYLTVLNEDGSWPGIDYQDDARTHWEPAAHTHRLAALAEVYDVSKDADLIEPILRALRFWIAQDPQSNNWWFNCIDTPKYLGRTLLLMGDAVSQDIVEGTERIIRRSSFKRTGANLIWESGNLMVLACAVGDAPLMKDAVAQIAGEIRITTEEGIQPDFSFHQHGPQLYMSNYGAVFSGDNSRYAVLFDGTSFALSDEKIAALSGLIREGQQWFVWGQQFDYHGMGRQIDSPGASRRGRGFARVCDRMAQVDPAHAEEYAAFAKRVSGDAPPGSSGPKGNRHYWRSDIMVHRPGDFYTSVRMHSTRTYACEVRVNRENLKGYHLSDGAYFVLQRGDEYHDIQPVWNWRKLPGVTFKDTNDPFPYGRETPGRGNTEFVGGVSDGAVGLAVMDYAKEDVKAHKSYFYFDDGFVCLGAGISSGTDEPVTTSINQCLLNGNLLLLRDGEDPMDMDSGDMTVDHLKGVYHDGIGYVILEPSKVVISAGPQTGTWTSIEERSSRKEPITQQVFSAWIDHGPNVQNGAYAYAVMPGMDREAFAARVNDPSFAILANAPVLQAVAFGDSDVVQAAFWEAGSLTVPDGMDVSVSAPCLVMVKTAGDNAVLSVSDPTQALGQLRVTLSGAFEGEGCVVEGRRSVVTVDLPQNEWAGQTVQVALAKK